MYPIQVYYDEQKKFCDQCESSVKERTFPVEIENVNADDVRINLLDEALCNVPGDSFHFWMRDNNVHIWIANRRIPDVRDLSFNSKQNIQYAPFTAELIAKEIEQFSSFYEKEIVLLQQEYGEENVDVQWGLIHYIY
jgi:acyl-homoserine lactone acylase PvdQ